MTCEQAWKTIASSKPSEVTRAERGAVYGHLLNCAPCFARMTEKSGVVRITREAAELAAADASDPEYLVLLAGKKE